MSHARRRSIAFGVCALLMDVSLSACSYLPFGNTTHSTDLKVGQCIQVPDSSQVGSVVTTECTEEHTGEVYFISTITQDSLPSSSEMDELIAAACFDSFEDYVGTSPRGNHAGLHRNVANQTRPGPTATARSSASPCAPTTSS